MAYQNFQRHAASRGLFETDELLMVKVFVSADEIRFSQL